jgi:hypothetical protein
VRFGTLVACGLISDNPDGSNAGAAAAWVDTVEAFGSGKLSVAEILEPAIRLATEGYTIVPVIMGVPVHH